MKMKRSGKASITDQKALRKITTGEPAVKGSSPAFSLY